MITGLQSVQVYPRVRGGTGGAEDRRRQQEGLSPRARGNQRELLLLGLLAGSIPACAGEPG